MTIQMQENRDPAYIAANTEAYGFTWVYRDLNKNKDQKTLLRANVPHINVSDEQFATFLVNFPATVKASINGTSAVIRGQNVVRPFLRHNPKASDSDLATHIVRSVLLNQITRTGGGTRSVYVGTDGRTYATLAEAQAAATSKAAPVPSDTDMAAEFMAEALDAGFDMEAARKLAAKRWPKAFETADEEVEVEG